MAPGIHGIFMNNFTVVQSCMVGFCCSSIFLHPILMLELYINLEIKHHNIQRAGRLALSC